MNENGIYPNPDIDRIKFKEPVQSIYFFSTEGKLLKSSVNSENRTDELDISELSSGVYILKVITNGILITTKIIKT